LLDKHGQTAASNASQVEAIARQAQSRARGLATVEQAKRLMNIR
jgi:uncharacterized protein (DUF849 family)